MIKSCLHCGKSFVVTNTRQKFCSFDCYSKYRQAPRVLKNCLNCGKKFIRPKRENPKFCSQKCYFEYRKKKALVAITCKNCGKIFYTTNYYKKLGRKFCSRECHKQYVKQHPVRVPLTCPTCQKTIFVLPCVAKYQKFCSLECYYKFVKGKKDTYKNHDKHILLEIQKLEKQGYKCIPIGLSKFSIPDIIAIKNNHIMAVEIDIHTSSKQKCEKYKKYFDEIKIKTIPIYKQASVDV